MAAQIPPKVSRIVDIFVSLAAAVVIVGALFKIMHWKGADEMLIIGLGTEALVFGVYGALYLRYPAIDDHQVKLAGADPSGNPALKTMEKMHLPTCHGSAIPRSRCLIALILYDVRTQRIIPRRDGKLAGGG